MWLRLSAVLAALQGVVVVVAIELKMVGLQPAKSPPMKPLGLDYTGFAHVHAKEDAVKEESVLQTVVIKYF